MASTSDMTFAELLHAVHVHQELGDGASLRKILESFFPAGLVIARQSKQIRLRSRSSFGRP